MFPLLNILLILICLIQNHCLNYESVCKIFQPLVLYYIIFQTFHHIFIKISLHSINQNKAKTDLTSTGRTIEMLDLLCVFLGHSNTVSMVPFLTIVTTTVGEEREKIKPPYIYQPQTMLCDTESCIVTIILPGI